MPQTQCDQAVLQGTARYRRDGRNDPINRSKIEDKAIPNLLGLLSLLRVSETAHDLAIR